MQPIKAIGKGAYGVVCSAKNSQDNQKKVAIKKIQNAFNNDIDARRTLREVTLLRQLQHDNIVNLVDVMAPLGSTKEKFKDVYLVYDLMDTDLHQIIRSKQGLSDDHFQYFTYQVQCLGLLQWTLTIDQALVHQERSKAVIYVHLLIFTLLLRKCLCVLVQNTTYQSLAR